MATDAMARPRWPAERAFYLGLTSAMLLSVLVGFARSFYLKPLFPGWPAPAEPVFYLHGAVFTAWCVLLVGQAALVSSGRTALHRRVGVWGALLAGAMVVLGTHASLVGARRPGGFVGIPGSPLEFLAVPICDMVLFGSFVAVAIAKRRDLQAHKRWMLLATMNLLTAAIARWPGIITIPSPLVSFFLADLYLVALVVWDLRSRGRLHAATAWGGALLVLSQPLRLAVAGTPAWLAVARWLVDSPL